MAKDIAQQIQSWLPSTTATDHASQQRILELETELAEVKATQGDTSSPADPPGTSDAAGMPPIQQALHGRSPSTSTFGSSSLLVTPVTVNPWLEQNQPTSWEAIRTLKPGPYPERPRKRIFMAIGCFHVHW